MLRGPSKQSELGLETRHCQSCIAAFKGAFSDRATCTWPEPWPPLEKDDGPAREGSHLDGPVLHQNFRDLEISAKAGCPTCQIFRQKLLHEKEYAWLLASTETIDLLRCTQVKPQLIDQLSLELGIVSVLLFDLLDRTTGKYGQASKEASTLTVTANSLVQHADTIKLLQEWLDDCYQNHSFCNDAREAILSTRNKGSAENGALASSFRPRRLLHIRRFDSTGVAINLIETGTEGPANNHADYRYVALSYVWGPGVEHFTTTRDNYRDHLGGVPWDRFPQTFRDTVLLTYKLGCRHLWIDALCIIQPDSIDTSDWDIESSKMGETYRHAYLTLAPARGDSVNDGFLQVRYNFEHTLSSCRVDQLVPEDFWTEDRAKAHLWITPTKIRWSVELALSAISTRAWCFQERLLSPRTVFISRYGLLWECYKHKIAEDQPIDRLESVYRRSWEWTRLVDQHFGWRSWQSIVCEFTGRSLTVVTDILPAISGVAKLFAQSRNGNNDNCDYFAGLWKSSFAQDLCWLATSKRPAADWSRTRISNFPSWSWASIHARIAYPLDRPKMSHRVAKICDREMFDPAKGEYVLTVIQIWGTPALPGIFGNVIGGKIRVQGKLKSFNLEDARLLINPSALSQDEEGRSRARRTASKATSYLDLYMDTLEHRDWVLSQTKANKTLSCLRAHRDHLQPGSNSIDDIIEQHYLVLKKMSNDADSNYCRMGYLVERMTPKLGRGPYLQDDGEMVEVEIV